MTEKIKASRYNHFVPLENGNRLAFNALRCGLAELDPESYQRYCDVIARGEINGDGQDDLIIELKKGGFITPAELDELDAIRASHYMARFGNRTTVDNPVRSITVYLAIGPYGGSHGI